VIEQHHLLPKEFKGQFKRLGFDIEEYKIPLTASQHRLKSGNGIHTGPESWNKRWDEFFRKVENPTKEDAIKFLIELRRDFKI
jgi:Predicted lipoprotein of unknown function (DUF2380)